MNQLLDSGRHSGTAASRTASPISITSAVVGLVITVVGLGVAVLDQAVLHGLDQHLHAMYDPIGKSGQPGPLYIYLYSVAALGVVCWLVTLRLIRAGARRARVWAIVILVLSALAITPLFLQEYGQNVFPLRLTLWYAAGWALGLLTTLTIRRR